MTAELHEHFEEDVPVSPEARYAFMRAVNAPIVTDWLISEAEMQNKILPEDINIPEIALNELLYGRNQRPKYWILSRHIQVT